MKLLTELRKVQKVSNGTPQKLQQDHTNPAHQQQGKCVAISLVVRTFNKAYTSLVSTCGRNRNLYHWMSVSEGRTTQYHSEGVLQGVVMHTSMSALPRQRQV